MVNTVPEVIIDVKALILIGTKSDGFPSGRRAEMPETFPARPPIPKVNHDIAAPPSR